MYESPFYYTQIKSNGAISDINQSFSKYSEQGYIRIDDQTLEITEGSEISFEVVGPQSIYFKSNVWIDLNMNNRFDQSEMIYSGDNTGYGTSNVLSFSFDVPDSLNSGNSVIRFRITNNSSMDPNPCGSIENSSVLDLPVRISQKESQLY